MFKKTDPYSFVKFVPLFLEQIRIGTLRLDYQVTNFENVQLQDSTSIGLQSQTRQYLLHCTQTVNLFNPEGLDISPSTTLDSYSNYPLMLNSVIEPEAASRLTFQILEYAPQTVNTKVQASGATGGSTGATTGVSSSSTVGSSTAETNSYGASVTLSETPSVSANYEHSSTTTSEHSNTLGLESSNTHSRDSSNTASMSVKDWGAYALVNPSLSSVVWTFGQEYPWDAVECRLTNGKISPGGQTEIVIPTVMSARLYDGVSLYPPSHLSTFGMNFVMKALWLVSVDNGDTTTSPAHADVISLTHKIDYVSGSHLLLADSESNGTQSVHAYMDPKPARLQTAADSSFETTLDLGLMALDAVGKGVDSAIIGFIPRKFTVLPVPCGATLGPVPFEIFAGTNNLLIKDTTAYPASAPSSAGFNTSETALLATFVPTSPALSMTLYFKILDSDTNYTLFFKHWIKNGSGVALTVTINADPANEIKKFVVSVEGEGGENNLTRINLRNLDFSSADYSDYLQLGLNSIEITLTPLDGTQPCEYQIRAISVEKE